eukprot:gene4455-3185_t
MSSARPKSTSSASRGGGRSYAKPTHNSRPNSRAQQLIEQQQATEKRQIVGQYMLGKTIGEGTFGKVKLAAHMPTGEKVAVKILEKSRIKEAADVRRVNREIKILKKARHPNVIQLYEVLDTQNAIYLIMECCDGGEMFDFIVAQKRVNEVQACKFFHQIVEGVDEIHKNEITHRDLKPENLLLKASPDGWIIKVVDFGLSNTHEGNRLLSTACGSPCYAAPEMIAGKKYVGPLADIWSMGVILFALVCGFLPFEDPNTAVLYKKILAGDYKAPKFISPEVRDLIARILETDPRRRYTMQDIRQHVWYTMVPESEVPKESVDVYNDERTRADTVATLGQAGVDTQSLLDGLASHACNSLTAMYYLYEQKQRNLRARSNNQQQSRPEISGSNPPTDASAATGQRSAPASRQPSAAGGASVQRGSSAASSNAAPTPGVTSAPAPTGLPLHGVYRPVPPGQAPVTIPASTAETVTPSAPTSNMPSLDLYMKQGAQLPSIQPAGTAVPTPAANGAAPVSNAPANGIQRPLVVPPLQFSQQQQLQAQQKPVPVAGGSQSARPTAGTSAGQPAGILGSLTARPAVPGQASAHKPGSSSGQPPANSSHQHNGGNTVVPTSVAASVPVQQQQLLAVQEGEVPVMIPTAMAGADTESAGGRPNTRRSRVRSRGMPGMGHLDDEATNGMGPAIGSLGDAPDALSQPMQQLQIQPMDSGVVAGASEAVVPPPLVSPGSVRTGGVSSFASGATPAEPAKIVPEQPVASRASSNQGGRRGRNLVPANKAGAADAPSATAVVRVLL